MGKKIPFLLGFILLALTIWLQTTFREPFHSVIDRANNITYDFQLRTRLEAYPQKVTSPVAIVDIDDRSLQIEGRWPWPRSKLANLVRILQQQGAVVIAMDMMFSEPEINIVDMLLEQLKIRNIQNENVSQVLNQIHKDVDNDAQLAQSFSQLDVTLGMTFLFDTTQATGSLPEPLFKINPAQEKDFELLAPIGYTSNILLIQTQAKTAGFINATIDNDGVLRRLPILMRYKNEVYPSLAFAAVKLYLLSDMSLVTEAYNNQMHLEGVRLGTHFIPTDAKGQVFIPFRGKSFTFPYFSATDVLKGKVPPDSISGKILFVGTSAIGLGDIRATSVQGMFPGIEIQATIADGILTDNFSFKPAWTRGAEICLTVILGIIFTITFPFLGPRFLTLVIILMPIVLTVLNNLLWEKTGLILFIFMPLCFVITLAIANLIYGYIFETRKREKLKNIFGQYVPASHIDKILASGDDFGLLGEDRELTVLFADIRNFTTISELMSAAELKLMLTQFFDPLTEIIFKFQGTIDKYIGDLIMAFWGAPLKDQNHAEHALNSALEMQEAITKLRPIFVAKGWAEIHVGIGLNTGVMSVGDMGSSFRRNYTVLGDAVNLGSRVESLTKHYGVDIMTTEFTIKDQTKFVFRPLDRVKVKGKKIPVTIYEVVGHIDKVSTETLYDIVVHEKALVFYYAKDWENALTEFKKVRQSTCVDLFIKRIYDYQENPPEEGWDGSYTLSEK